MPLLVGEIQADDLAGLRCSTCACSWAGQHDHRAAPAPAPGLLHAERRRRYPASSSPPRRKDLLPLAAGHTNGQTARCLPYRLVTTLPLMICRLWRGWATNQNADAYERIVRDQVIPGIEARHIPGFRSIDLVRREREHDVEFMTLMWFDSLDAVKAFMGDDYEVAHVPAAAQAVLADFDKRSAHYQVLDRRDQPR
jgi:heme-degrading monooxygenase HmoA